MKIITNEPLIKRNAMIGKVTMIAGLSVLGLGMYLSFSFTDARYFYLSLLSLLVGFILSQVSIFYTNRFGRKPRPDELLNSALKGLDYRHTLYHYLTPVSHLLVGPSGIWLLLARSQRGQVSYSKGRWRQRGGSLYLKLFAQENLGRPDLDIAAEGARLERYFAKTIEGVELPTIRAVLVLLHPAATVNISEEETPPAETATVKDLKDVIKRAAKGKSIPAEKLAALTAALPQETV